VGGTLKVWSILFVPRITDEEKNFITLNVGVNELRLSFFVTDSRARNRIVRPCRALTAELTVSPWQVFSVKTNGILAI
jgi:hypothetical protein